MRQGLLSFALFFGALGPTSGKKFSKTTLGLEIPFSLFWGACFLSWLGSNYELSSRLEIADLVLFIGLVFLVAWGVGANDARKLVWAAVLVGAAYAFFANYQKFVLGQSRCASTLFNPNFAASFFLGAVGYALGLLSQPSSGRFKKFLNLGALVVLLAGIWSTGSRSGLAGLVLVWGTFLWAVIRKARWAIAGVFVLVAALIIFPNPARDRLSKGITKDPYAFDRIRIWEQTLKIIWDHPLTGVGIGNFEYSTQAYRFPVEREIGRFGRVYRDAHNSYLQVAAEVGLPAATILLAAILILFLRIRTLLDIFNRTSGIKVYLGVPKLKDLSNEFSKDIGVESLSAQGRVTSNPARAKAEIIGALLALIAVMSQAFFHEIVDSPPSLFLAALAAGLVGFHWRTHLEEKSSQEPQKAAYSLNRFRPSKIVLTSGALFLLLIFFPHFSLRAFLADQVFKKAEKSLPILGVEVAELKVRDAIRLNPAQPYFHKALGDLLMEKFDQTQDLTLLPKAEEEFVTAASLNRMDPHLVFHIGQFYSYVSLRGIGDKEVKDSAIQAYRKAVQMSPFNVHYLVWLSLEELRQNNFSQAIDAAARAVELEPRFLAALFLLVQVSTAVGDELQAEKWRARLMEAREVKKKWVPLNEYERLLIAEPEKYFGQEIFPWKQRQEGI